MTDLGLSVLLAIVIFDIFTKLHFLFDYTVEFHLVHLNQVSFRSDDAKLMNNFISYVKIITFLFIRPIKRTLPSRSSAIW